MKDYSIGDASKRLGISRDTLRFYEKKGIIRPHKMDNGYRSYSYEDIRTLLDIRFYRRLNFSIENINSILHRSSYHSFSSMIQEKVEEEKREVRRHQQSLVYLQYLKLLYQNIEFYLNDYDIRPLRRYFKMDDSNLIDKLDIFDLCFIYQEYRIDGQSLEQTDEYFLFAANTAVILDLEKELENNLFIQHEKCVYTVVASDSRIPCKESILKAAKWASDHGYELSGTAYSGYLLSCARHEGQGEAHLAGKELCAKAPSSPVYYIELYLPIS